MKPYTFQPKLEKTKKVHPEQNSLYFRKWIFLILGLRNILYFLTRKLFLYFRKWNPAFSGLSPQNVSLNNFLYFFLKIHALKEFLIFSQKKLMFQ